MANKSSKIVKEGFLVKSPPPDKLMAGWHKRFFVLWSSGYIEYYSTSDKKPQDYLKTINLNNCEDMVAPFPVSGRTYVIKIAISNKGKNRDYFLDCDNQEVMDEWVTKLAEVCGFTAVDYDENEQDNYSEIALSPPPPLPTAPRPPLPEDISHTSPTPPLINKPKLRPPLPPPKPSSPSDDSSEFSREWEMVEEVLYEETMSHSDLNTLNSQPPPVWRNPANICAPPPLPNRQRKFTRSSSSGSNSLERPKLNLPSFSPPPLPDRSTRGEANWPIPGAPQSTKGNDSSRIGSFSSKKLPMLPKSKKTKPVPPTKNTRANTPPTRAITPPMQSTRMSFQEDLASKLNQGKRKMVRSWSENSAEDQPPYEEINYPGEDSPPPSFDAHRRLGVTITGPENDDGYVDCDPSIPDEPQEYLDYKRVSAFLAESSHIIPPQEVDLPLPLPPRERPSLVPSPQPYNPSSNLPPVPSRSSSSQSQNFSPEEDEEEAPPVPRRHPHASGGNKQRTAHHSVPNHSRGSSPNNVLPLPPKCKSPVPSINSSDEEAPPVPTRGVESLRQPLTKQHSDNRTGRGPKPNPPRIVRGVSLPADDTRLPIPPPKTVFHSQHNSIDENESEEDENGFEQDENIFEEINFNRTKQRGSSLNPSSKSKPRGPVSSPPGPYNGDISSKPPATKPKLRPPLPVPKSQNSELTPKPSPPSVSSKPRTSLSPPRVTPKPRTSTTPSVAQKPQKPPVTAQKPPKGPTFKDPSSAGGSELRKTLPTPPVHKDSELKKKPPPTPSKNLSDSNSVRKDLPFPIPERKKLPDSSFLNGQDVRKQLDKPPSNSPRAIRKNLPDPPMSNSPETRKLPDPPLSNGPRIRKKLPDPSMSNGPETRKKLPDPTISNGPETAKKPPPAPRVKPVMRHLNNDLAASLQNNPSPGFTKSDSNQGGSSSGNKRPMLPVKPKPLVPPKR